MEKGSRRSDRDRGDGEKHPPRRGFRGTAENAKTKICLRWQNGECRFGDRCNFAHGESELRSLPPREGSGAGGRGGGRGGRGRGGAAYDGNSYRDDFPQGHGDNGNVAPGAGVAQGYPNELYSRPSARDHAKWVAAGCPIVGHGGWTQYQTEKGEKYYHNKNTDVTQWDPPAEWKGPV